MKPEAVLAALMIGLHAGAAAAETYTLGSLQISQPWARATPRGASVAGAYLVMTNSGREADRLTGGTAAVAARFEIHKMEMEDTLATMRPVQGGVEIKPGETLEFAPTALHVMLIGLKQPLLQGEHFKGTLVFAKAGKVDVEFSVVPIGASGPAAAGQVGR
jgi:copper(I)-binding protein